MQAQWVLAHQALKFYPPLRLSVVGNSVSEYIALYGVDRPMASVNCEYDVHVWMITAGSLSAEG